MDNINNLFERRAKLCERLEKALAHKSRLELIQIISSFFSIEELENLVKFQER